MGNLEKRLEIKDAAKKRVSAMSFGEPCTNVCAGEAGRHLYFFEYVIKSRKNRYGFTNNEYLAKCTNKEKKTCNIDIEVIYPGHLDDAKCKELFEPIWQAHYGS
jgi:hypothetical protein